nr:PIN domain-containing protein [Candidatus Hydrogenedentota bacterium]
MKVPIVLDTGPLVASINKRDRFYAWARTQLAQLQAPLITCEAVLAESCFLLQEYDYGSAAVLEMVRRGILNIDFHVESQIEAIAKLMSKYSDVPMSLADACLVRLAELHPQSAVMT